MPISIRPLLMFCSVANSDAATVTSRTTGLVTSVNAQPFRLPGPQCKTGEALLPQHVAVETPHVIEARRFSLLREVYFTKYIQVAF